MKTDKIENDKFVAFSYKVTDTDGNLLFETPESAPDTIVYGRTEGFATGLADALYGLKEDDCFSVTLPPEAAFGQREESLIFKLGPEVFSADGNIPASVKVDAILPMMTDTGQKIYGRVIEVTPEAVTMDFNHPFAGKTVTYEGKVIEVRSATEDEFNPGHCCGGCGGGGCSDSDCGGCGGGCH